MCKWVEPLCCRLLVPIGPKRDVSRSVVCGDQLVDQRDEDAISLKGDFEFKGNKQGKWAGGKERAGSRGEDVDHREDVEIITLRARTKMSSLRCETV